MAQVSIGEVDDEALDRLRKRAEENHRSLEGVLREIILNASRQAEVETARLLMREMRERLGGREHSDSTLLIREDRDR